MPRIEPVSEPYDPELLKWMPPGVDHDPLLLFRVLQRHPGLASRMRVLGPGLLGHGELPAVDREVVILRACVRCGCEYEWGVHAAVLAKQAGLTEEHFDAGPDNPVWSARHRVLLRAVDELHDTATISDSLWDELREHYTDEQLIEIVVLTGWYRIISTVANATRLELEPWAYRSARFGQKQ